jgi:hypothetical protein
MLHMVMPALLTLAPCAWRGCDPCACVAGVLLAVFDAPTARGGGSWHGTQASAWSALEPVAPPPATWSATDSLLCAFWVAAWLLSSGWAASTPQLLSVSAACAAPFPEDQVGATPGESWRASARAAAQLACYVGGPPTPVVCKLCRRHGTWRCVHSPEA